MSDLPPVLPPPTSPEQPAPSASLPDEAGAPSSRRRRLVIAASAALTVLAALVVVLSLRDDSPPASTAEPEALDAWAPYWVLDVSGPELARRLPLMRELSPFWYAATGVDTIELDPNAPEEQVNAFLAAARDGDALIVPSIVDSLDAGGMAAILADPATRARHVEAIATFADEADFAGVDIDYEKFAFADDRSTWSTTRPHWVAFISELADRLHDDGRTLTVSIPPVYDEGRTNDSGYWVYDYASIAPLVDRIRVMAYDFSTSEPGPIAPLSWVQEAIDGTAAASGHPEKLVLGTPAYGYNWVVATTGTCPAGEASGRTSVTARSAPELAARRGVTPLYDELAGEWTFTYDLEVTDGSTTCTQRREVHYVDGAGARARRELAEEAGFDGAALWALGYEDDAFWETAPPAPATTNP